MTSIKKTIFGKVYQFNWSESFNAVVNESIALYPEAMNTSTVDVNINISMDLEEIAPISVNPRIHEHAPRQMRTIMGRVRSSWMQRDGVLHIGMAVPRSGEFRRILRKVYSKEFSTDVEIFEQILHELILVPSVYFSEDTAPIHAAAVSTGSGAILLAGTGGVGKSSALIAFREEAGAQFIADDIAVIAADGRVYGNMAWPKIYGYNCAGNGMAKEILAGRGVTDKAHFYVRNRVNPQHVRRKMAPDRLYSSVYPTGKPLKRLLYLFKEDVPELAVSPMSLDNAVEMTVSVLESEYGVFHNHLNWEEYNAYGTNGSPLLSMGRVREKWRRVYRSAFANTQALKVSIPLRIDHAKYQSEILQIISREARSCVS